MASTEVKRALVIGDGPSYHAVSGFDWGSFDGDVIATHVPRHRAKVVISIDPRSFERKERHAIGSARLVIAMSHWGNGVGLKRFVPKCFHKHIVWAWCNNPVLTSGVYAIEWAAQQGYTEIYTMGVDLNPGYHRRLDTQRSLLAKTISSIQAKGIQVFKRSPESTLPVPVKEPSEKLAKGYKAPAGMLQMAHAVSPVVERQRRIPVKAGKPMARPAAADEQKRVLIRPKNGKRPYVVHVPSMPRS